MEKAPKQKQLSGPVLWAADPTGNRLKVRVIKVEGRKAEIVLPNGAQTAIPCEWLYIKGGK